MEKDPKIDTMVQSFLDLIPSDLRSSINPILEEVLSQIDFQKQLLGSQGNKLEPLLKSIEDYMDQFRLRCQQYKPEFLINVGLQMINEIFELKLILNQLRQQKNTQQQFEKINEIILDYEKNQTRNQSMVFQNSEQKCSNNHDSYLQKQFDDILDRYGESREILGKGPVSDGSQIDLEQVKFVSNQYKQLLKSLFSEQQKCQKIQKELNHNKLVIKKDNQKFETFTQMNQELINKLFDFIKEINNKIQLALQKGSILQNHLDGLIKLLIKLEVKVYPEQLSYIFCIYWLKQGKVPLKFTPPMIIRQACEQALNQSISNDIINELQRMPVSNFFEKFYKNEQQIEVGQPASLASFGQILMSHLVSAGTIDEWKEYLKTSQSIIQLVDSSSNAINTIKQLCQIRLEQYGQR